MNYAIFERIMIIRLTLIIALLWAGMILGISFLESWVKFRAPLVTLIVGLDVGRTVFSYFHTAQTIWLICLICLCAIGKLPWSYWLIVGLLAIIFVLQTNWLFPLLKQQVEVIISGGRPSSSYVHSLYGIGEVIKFLLLITLSVKLFDLCP